jgi:protein required for attachment to host cells
MKTFWIVVADAGRALVLRKVVGHHEVATILHDLENPAGRMRTSELVSDGRGRVETGGGTMQSAMDPRTDAHEQKAIVFSREVVKALDTAADRHEYDSLILVAPAHFLGLLKSNLGRVAARKLAMSQTKDLTHASMTDLESHIDEWIRQPGISLDA